MTVLYGSTSDVAALAGTYTTGGAFSTTTTPTLAQVTAWLTDVSDLMDLALAQHHFEIPIDTGITNYDKITNLLSTAVVPLVAELSHAANGVGKFFTQRSIEFGGSSPANQMKAVTHELNKWIEEFADGLVALGLTQTPVISENNVQFIRTIKRKNWE